jgi:hypothetical protein
MKPTSQLTSKPRTPQSVPVVDYSYQSTLEATHTAIEREVSAPPKPSLWQLSGQVLGAKTTAEYVRELVAFAVIAGLSAWPIVTVAIAITRMVRNY